MNFANFEERDNWRVEIYYSDGGLDVYYYLDIADFKIDNERSILFNRFITKIIIDRIVYED